MARYLNDTFTSGSSEFLDGAHIADSGAGWRAVENSNGTADVVVNGGVVTLQVSTIYYWANLATPGSVNQEVTAEFTPNSDTWGVGVLARVQGDDSGYVAFISSGSISISKKLAAGAGFTTLATAASPFAAGERGSHTLSLLVSTSASVNTFSVKVDGSTFAIGSITADNTILTAGLSGLGGRDCTSTLITGDDDASAAPTLTSPTGAATGNTTANVGATTDAGSGTLYASVSASAPSAAQIKLGQDSTGAATTSGNVAVSSPGAKTIGLTGVATGSRSVWLVHNTTAGDSNVVNATWTQAAAPVLSSPTNTPGSTTALIGATTTVSSGTAYFLPRVGGSAASAATIIATGQTSTVTTTTPSRTVTGLTASTPNNYVDIVQVSGVTTSNVVSTAAFTTTASGDTTPPTLTGSIVIGTVTSSSIQFSWSAGSDNVAVTSYEVSSNGGSGYVDAGNVLTYTFTGLTASTSYGLRVRAKDAAGNVSTPALAATQSTAAASGVGSISLNNAALYTFRKNNGAIIVSTGVTFFVSNVTTGALIGSAITGLSTNAQGLVTTAISNASMLAGTTYRLSYEFSSGEYGSVKLPAV